ncbi:hypothetical protein SteCoe_19125 [Stentor coeruleus]|uniref:Uncharacterized protein n=1 Tax=Stentor coeruleus TaxID=5963 RepID=A0A1R2BUV6_9CILI|nr:hypothetical protein SteCoe_19125 [Stentor coeruleus]
MSFYRDTSPISKVRPTVELLAKQDIKSHLIKTIYEFEKNLPELKGCHELATEVNIMISKLKTLSTKRNLLSQEKLEELQKKGLKEIFDFYSRQIKMIGQSPTFTQLTDHKKALNLSKFTKFCADFDLINNTKDKHKLSLKTIANLFMKATNCQRNMIYEQFLIAIDLLADAFYSKDRDFYYRENLSKSPIEDKKKTFLGLLNCGNPNAYIKKLKGFGEAFSAEKKDYRIPDYDLSKKYKYRDSSKVKQKIESWKQKKVVKQMIERSKSVPTEARMTAIKQSLLLRADRITWDMLMKNTQFMSKDDLNMLLDPEDINELIKKGVRIL